MPKQIKKIIPYFLILIILVGLFRPMGEVKADPVIVGTPAAATIAAPAAVPTPTQTLTTTEGSALAENNGSCKTLLVGDVEDCLVKIAYYVFYVFPAFLLTLSAKLFNILIALTLSSSLYTATFISEGWAVVRDFVNIFFILILLYVAIQTILGMGHETKKIIVRVIIMALLINFSMFFTKVIIDSSNILALVFYNKIDSKSKDYIPSTKISATGVQEKDFTGSMVSAFDPTKLMSADFFKKAKEKTQSVGVGTIGTAGYVAGGAYVGSFIPIPIVGTAVGAAGGYAISKVVGLFITTDKVPPGLMIGIIVSAGLIMLFAAYCFFIAGMSFLSRLIELWILIIFSPFAFMSWPIPKLSGTPSIGWDEWLKRVLKLSFMAPIFMFFLYLIFKLINTNIFQSFVDRNYEQQGTLEAIVLIVLPSLVILILLNRATKYAKDASGELGSAVISGAKLVAGLAVGGAALGGASILRGSVGAFMKGASTGDTAAGRLSENTARIAANRLRIADPHTTGLQKFQARIDNLKAGSDIRSGLLQQKFGIEKAQKAVGKILNEDQHDVEHAGHARHDLDKAANEITPGKKWEELNGQQRYEARRQIARDRVVRDNQGAAPAAAPTALAPSPSYVAGLGAGFGTRGWDKLTTAERALVDRSAAVGHDPVADHAMAGGALDTHTTVADKLIIDARKKQDIASNVIQSGVTGSYDVRNLANVIAKEQSTGFAKMAMGITGALAMGMRGGFKSMGVNYGESQKNFFKDLGNTVTEALKSAKINVDLSHVGEVKKEENKGGGGHH